MGAVYKASLPGLNKIVALKRLAPSNALIMLMGRDEIRRRFTVEARTMGGLRHRNIAAVWDFQDDEDETFFVMEYYCQDLGTMIGERYDLERPSRQVGENRALRYAMQTLEGLARLHEAGIVHRDIKPFNLLITEDDVVKITDFGMSKLRGETMSGSPRLHVGSPYYTAPEQERSPNAADARSDLYSLGVTLFRMLTGYLPINGSDSLLGRDTTLSEEWRAVFSKSLARDPDRRYESTRAFLNDLRAIAKQRTNREESDCLMDPAPRPQGSERAFRPRSEPIRVRPREARVAFDLDELFRPRQYSDHDLIADGDGTILDRTTGLCWQAAGADYVMTWDEAGRYVDSLNRSGFGGRSNWRLPTVNELMSVLSPQAAPGGYCLEAVFERDRPWLWSADTRSALAAWYVDVDLGYAAYQDRTCYFFVRAVA